MPKFEVDLPSGKYEVDAPNERKAWEYANFHAQSETKPAPAPVATTPPRSTERTWGEAMGDLGASLTQGVGSLTQLPGQIYGLATGDFSDTGRSEEHTSELQSH